jgi:hypothetical protein
LFLTRGMSALLTAVTALIAALPTAWACMISAPPEFDRMWVVAPSVRSDLTMMMADVALAWSVEATG